MNRIEWEKFSQFGGVDRKYDNACRKIQKSLKYNPNPEATVRHHLRDTEEQRKYNDEHYELWGFNLDGTFEYGKYIIFLTKKEHDLLHQNSKESKEKRVIGIKRFWTKEKRKERSEKTSGENCYWFGKKRSEEDKKKMSLAKKGKHLLKEHIEHIRQSTTGKKHKYKSEETRNVVINYMKNNNPSKPIRQDLKDLLPQKSPKSPLAGKKLSEETKKKMSLSKIGKPLREDVYNNLKQVSKLYKEYKSLGGSYSWNEFQFIMKHKPDLLKDKLKSYL